MLVLGNPTQAAHSYKGNLHLFQFESSEKSLCGLARKYREYGGRKVQVMFEIDKPVNCQACMKSIEMVLRTQLRMLSFTGLMKVMETVQGLKNGDIR